MKVETVHGIVKATWLLLRSLIPQDIIWSSVFPAVVLNYAMLYNFPSSLDSTPMRQGGLSLPRTSPLLNFLGMQALYAGLQRLVLKSWCQQKPGTSLSKKRRPTEREHRRLAHNASLSALLNPLGHEVCKAKN